MQVHSPTVSHTWRAECLNPGVLEERDVSLSFSKSRQHARRSLQPEDLNWALASQMVPQPSLQDLNPRNSSYSLTHVSTITTAPTPNRCSIPLPLRQVHLPLPLSSFSTSVAQPTPIRERAAKSHGSLQPPRHPHGRFGCRCFIMRAYYGLPTDDHLHQAAPRPEP